MSFYDFYTKYFSINLNQYSNIGIDLELSKILFAFLIAIIVTTIIVNYKRASIITMVKRLWRLEAVSEETAKTLDELKINKFNAKLILTSEGRASKMIRRVGEKNYTYEEYTALIKKKGYKEERVDFATAKFYIEPEKKAEAQNIAETPAPTILNTILFCILSVAIYFCLIIIAPEILTFINKILGK